MTNPIDPQRRRLLATTSTLAAASLLNLAASGSAMARATSPSSNTAGGVQRHAVQRYPADPRGHA